MRIAVIGWGVVGQSLGNGWRTAGHEIRIGTRDPGSERAAQWRDAGWSVGSALEAAADADAVVLTMPGNAMPEVVAPLAPVLDGTLVIDTTNHLGPGPLHQLPALTAKLPSARIARCFTTMAWENFETPTIGGRTLDQYFVCAEGDTAEVSGLVRDLGLHPVRLGDVGDVDMLDALTRVWFHLVWQLGYPRRTAFTLTTIAQSEPPPAP